MASQTLDLPPEARVAAAPAPRLCDGCRQPLADGQKPGARHHGAACRQLSYRRKRRGEVLAHLDAIAKERAAVEAALDRVDAEVSRLRAEVERW